MEEEKKKKTVWFLPIVEMMSFKEKPVYDLLYYVIPAYDYYQSPMSTYYKTTTYYVCKEKNIRSTRRIYIIYMIIKNRSNRQFILTDMDRAFFETVFSTRGFLFLPALVAHRSRQLWRGAISC